jgi:hypothetical protein
MLGLRLRPLRRRERRQHDLDLVDQWLLRTLGRFRECSYRHLEAELLAIRGAAPHEVVSSILKLEEGRLLERTPVESLTVVERRFRLTTAGRRIFRLIPETPRSPTIFYV